MLVCEYWPAHFARVVASCCKEARGNVGTFSSDNLSDVSDLTKCNLVSNRRYA